MRWPSKDRRAAVAEDILTVAHELGHHNYVGTPFLTNENAADRYEADNLSRIARRLGARTRWVRILRRQLVFDGCNRFRLADDQPNAAAVP